MIVAGVYTGVVNIRCNIQQFNLTVENPRGHKNKINNKGFIMVNKDTPEFDFFQRLENIEARISKEFTDEDIALLATYSLSIAFMSCCSQFPDIARKMKDRMLGKLKTFGLSKSLLDEVEENLNSICDIYD